MNVLLQILHRSENLQAAIDELFEQIDKTGPARAELSFASCALAKEHAFSLRVLTQEGAGSSAIALLRLQYEAVARAIWLTWGADDEWVKKLDARLTVVAEEAAGKLPMLSDMLRAVENKAPEKAAEMLHDLKAAHWKALNSYVHGGIHPLRRIREGYPEKLLIQVIQNSNALATMGAMLMASWTNNASVISTVKSFQWQFCDCLPPLKR